MKKMLCVMLVVMMLMGTAFAEEEFTLHNGTKFGMSPNEVIELESSCNVVISEKPGPHERYLGKASVAGQSNTEIYYDFANGKLFQMEYCFFIHSGSMNEDSFISIESGLTKKYGETPYCSSTNQSLNSIRISDPKYLPYDSSMAFVQPYIGYAGDKSSSSETYSVYERLNYSQRILPLDDNSYVLIDHYLFTFTKYNSQSNAIVAGPDYSHILVYTLLSETEANQMLDENKPSNDDL